MIGITDLPLELLEEIASYVAGADFVRLQLSCKLFRTVLYRRQWNHLALDFGEPVRNPVNQFEHPRFPDPKVGFGDRIMRINRQNLDSFLESWIDGSLALIPSTVPYLSIDLNLKQDYERLNELKKPLGDLTTDTKLDYILTYILSEFSALKFIEVVCPIDEYVRLRPDIGRLYPFFTRSRSIARKLSFKVSGYSTPRADRLYLQNLKRVYLSLLLSYQSSRMITVLLGHKLPASVEALHIDYGQQHFPREGGDISDRLSGSRMREFLSEATKLKELKLYWNYDDPSPYDWIPDTVEELLLLDGERQTLSPRGKVVLPNVRKLIVETKGGKVFRKIEFPNLRHLSVRPSRASNQTLEGTEWSSHLLRTAGRELCEIRSLECYQLTYGAVLSFSNTNIDTLVVRSLMQGTTAFNDMETTMTEFLLQLPKAFPNLKVLFVELDQPIVSDQFQTILGTITRRHPALHTIYIGFEGSTPQKLTEYVKMTIGHQLVDGSATRVSPKRTYIQGPQGLIYYSLKHLYRLDLQTFKDLRKGVGKSDA
ncbi:hypothetical protein TRVA0_033S01816 [Trichomonascus vanleenenianus]|uniref:uncharacterized protein n=1 Tax=Trichomonascus vanleenenianus TaxID=2268995 RepID=UPI003ECACD0E